jgi:hypothetical protein
MERGREHLDDHVVLAIVRRKVEVLVARRVLERTNYGSVHG